MLRVVGEGLGREEALALAGFLGEACVPEPLSVSVFEEPGGWQVEALIEEGQAAALKSAVAAAGFDVALREEALPDVDWVAESQRRLPPVRAGRFFIHGAHDRQRVPKGGSIGIEIEAGQAFGSGHHGTTKGCLLALDWLLRQRRLAPGVGRRALDVGTGSGVLAIAAARALKWPVVASDIDRKAVQVAAENARKNGAAGLVRPVRAAGTWHELIRAHGPYQLVFANILANPLRRMAGELCGQLAAGGWLVLSGLLHEQERMVLEPYLQRGLELARRWRLEGWSTLLLQKPRLR